jgi:S-adenosyl-L-methionine hydrolase (adenosine-forming)
LDWRTPIITLTTDFGLNDHFVGAMKGVILEIAPEAQIVDISHAVQAFDILDGALTISQAYSYFPSGTVHMVVVDPGVGTARRPLILTGDRHLFVAPDNGVLSLIYDRKSGSRSATSPPSIIFCSSAVTRFTGATFFRRLRLILPRELRPIALAKRSPTMCVFARPVPSRWMSARCAGWC